MGRTNWGQNIIFSERKAAEKCALREEPFKFCLKAIIKHTIFLVCSATFPVWTKQKLRSLSTLALDVFRELSTTSMKNQQTIKNSMSCSSCETSLEYVNCEGKPESDYWELEPFRAFSEALIDPGGAMNPALQDLSFLLWQTFWWKKKRLYKPR